MVLKLDEKGFQLDTASGVSVVAFSANWCPPCKVMAPIYEEASARFTGMKFLKADEETSPEIFNRFGVQSIPTYLVLKEGKEVYRQVGAVPASRFNAMLERFS
jgi:thioredoxin 1